MDVRSTATYATEIRVGSQMPDKPEAGQGAVKLTRTANPAVGLFGVNLTYNALWVEVNPGTPKVGFCDINTRRWIGCGKCRYH